MKQLKSHVDLWRAVFLSETVSLWGGGKKNQCRKLQAKLDIFHTAYAPFAQFQEQSDY